MSNVPWFGPGVAASLLTALAAARALGSALGVPRVLAGTLVFSLGIVLSATLTPLRSALETGDVGTGICDLSRLGFAPIGQLDGLNDTSLNILLFIPLGLTVGLLPVSARMAVALIASIALPFLIEALQLALPELARGCQSADVVDNLTGLSIGVIFGGAARFASRWDPARSGQHRA